MPWHITSTTAFLVLFAKCIAIKDKRGISIFLVLRKVNSKETHGRMSSYWGKAEDVLLDSISEGVLFIVNIFFFAGLILFRYVFGRCFSASQSVRDPSA